MQQQLQCVQPLRCSHQQHICSLHHRPLLRHPPLTRSLGDVQQRQQQQWRRSSTSPAVCKSAASSAAFGDSSSKSTGGGRSTAYAAAAEFVGGLSDTARDVQELLVKFTGLWRSFLPMLSLFFCLSFINTILDSLKDTLVITAVGGGAFVIPYLTVYAVLPISVVFLFLYAKASHHMSRSALFNAIIVVFMAFFGVFALFMYPNADTLHPHALADRLQQVGGQQTGQQHSCWAVKLRPLGAGQQQHNEQEAATGGCAGSAGHSSVTSRTQAVGCCSLRGMLWPPPTVQKVSVAGSCAIPMRPPTACLCMRHIDTVYIAAVSCLTTHCRLLCSLRQLQHSLHSWRV